MKYMFIFFLCLSTLFALPPIGSIKADGNVMDIVYHDGNILVATDNGFVESYELNSSKLTKKIEFEKITDFTGDLIGAKIYSVDILQNGSILAVVQGKSFYRKLALVRDDKIKILLDSSKKLMIKKAKFIDENRVLIALLSNELILYDIKKEKNIYRISLSQSQFSDFALNEDKSEVACSSESGGVVLVDVQKGKKLRTLNSGNVDNVYKVDFKKNTIISAGQDRRGIVYHLPKGNFDRYDASFLIYACALSKDARYGALAIDEDNDIAVFDLKTKKQIALLKGQESTLNSIVFIDNKTLVSGSDDKNIKIWRIK
ncbi:MAG: hypothetical protein CR967_03625 [Proteobacteria bacterium]|nr:MAG: hypothetical protein CR967_03625 [Pseudomonadota bacterium]